MPPQTDISPSPGWYQKFKNAVKKMKREVLAVYYAIQDPEVGYLPRAVAGVALAYALSPLDLIPDFIPILGLIDDLLILPGKNQPCQILYFYYILRITLLSYLPPPFNF